MNAFPGLRNLMINTQKHASEYGYTETILGRRRHLPDMQLPEFEFKAMKGYVNPDVDPLDVNTLENRDEIPKHVVDDLKKNSENTSTMVRLLNGLNSYMRKNIYE